MCYDIGMIQTTKTVNYIYEGVTSNFEHIFLKRCLGNSHRIACYGDSHARRLAETERPTSLRFGRLQVGTKANADGTRSGLGTRLEPDAKWLFQAAVRGVPASLRPAAAVISFGSNAVFAGNTDDPSDRAHILAACERAVSGVVSVLKTDPFVTPIVMGVIPRAEMGCGAQDVSHPG